MMSCCGKLCKDEMNSVKRKQMIADAAQYYDESHERQGASSFPTAHQHMRSQAHEKPSRVMCE